MSRSLSYAKLLDTSGLIPSSNIDTLSGSKLIGAGDNALFPAGTLINSTIIRNSTRSTVTPGPSGTLFTGTFVKEIASSRIIAECTVFGAYYASGNCGVGMYINNYGWDYGTAYQYDGLYGTEQTTIIFGTGTWTGVAVGTQTIGFGWNTINNSAGERPFYYFNPNNTNDARNQQMVSSITVYEVL